MRHLRLLLPVALVLAAAPHAARAEVETRIALQTFHGVMVARTVRNLSAPEAATNPMLFVSVAGAVSVGALLAGINVGGAWGGAANRYDGFAGAFAGAELAPGPSLIRFVGEGGLHFVAGAGGDWSGSSDAPTVALPYLGVRAAMESQLSARRRTLSLGGSAFVRVDLSRRDVSGSVTEETCSLICGPVRVKTSMEVGGVMIGFGVSLAWWSDVPRRASAGWHTSAGAPG
jgi:hypothetical protein